MKSFVGVQGAVFQKSPLAAGGKKNSVQVLTERQRTNIICGAPKMAQQNVCFSPTNL
jgi:hypothetical protein